MSMALFYSVEPYFQTQIFWTMVAPDEPCSILIVSTWEKDSGGVVLGAMVNKRADNPGIQLKTETRVSMKD